MKFLMKFLINFLMNFSTKRYVFLLAFTLAIIPFIDIQARIAIIENENVSYELPRSQIKTYIQRGTLEENLKPVRAQRPGALSDEELIAIPERYLTHDLKQKQEEARERINKGAPAIKKARSIRPLEKSDVVKIRSGKNKVVSLKLDQAVWVPPTAATDSAILAPQRRLPEVELLRAIEISTSGEVQVEINPGDTREIAQLFQNGNTTDADKTELLDAYRYYQEKDFATALTLAIGVMSDPKANRNKKLYARYLAGHSLYQAGFYASTIPMMMELLQSKLRRSALGIISLSIEKTRDDGAANMVLSKLSLSQIPDVYRPIYAFHLGRVLLDRGAREAALSAFLRVPENHTRFGEAQYYLGVIRTSNLDSNMPASDWEKESSAVSLARSHFETALTMSRRTDAQDLRNLIRISLARLAYQAQQFNQATYYYQEVETTSPFAREAAYESAWSLYRVGEFNRSLGMLHPLGSKYFEDRDLPELWILRSLNYLKLCRFDEGRKSANTFETQLQELSPQLIESYKKLRANTIMRPSDLSHLEIANWVKSILLADPVYKKDLSNEQLLSQERDRLDLLKNNPRVVDIELKESTTQALQIQLDRRIQSLAEALMPYLISRNKDILDEYQVQRQRLDLLRFEIYSQATRFPGALERPEAQKLIDEKTFLPGVFLKGHEILWRFNSEHWFDELRSYDYFIPTECKNNTN